MALPAIGGACFYPSAPCLTENAVKDIQILICLREKLKKLLTEWTCIVKIKVHAEERSVWQGAAYLDQPVMGECVMLLTDGEDRDLIALDGQGALEKGQVMLSVQGAHIHLTQDESMQEALEKLLQMDRSDSGIRAVDAGYMTK